MTKRNSRRKRCRVQFLTLPELDQSKIAVLNSLGSVQSRRSYRYAMEEFIQWYCSEPRLALNRSVVLRYRLQLEGSQLAPATINARLAAIRRLAYEAADSGLLSPDLVAGIRRVKGVKHLGHRTGNWLSVQQGQLLLDTTDPGTLRGRRDAAMLALLLGCGLRRSELVALDISHFQQREEHWAIVDLVGKGGHVRTVPVPEWVKKAIDGWASAAGIFEGKLFRSIRKNGTLWGYGVTQNVVLVRCERLRKAGRNR
jgi:site-specific recombinase XerD